MNMHSKQKWYLTSIIMDFVKDRDIIVSGKSALLQVRDPWVLGANSNVVLTIQREHGVKDLALHLSRTLWGTAHPQPLVQTHSRDDGIAGVRWLLPLGQGSCGDDANPATQRQKVTQQL